MDLKHGKRTKINHHPRKSTESFAGKGAGMKSKIKPVETESPPVQMMEKSPPGYDPNRIPQSIFVNKPSVTTDWSVASNESLFSIRIGNTSFSRYKFASVPKEITQTVEPEISEDVPELGELGKTCDPTMDSGPDPIEVRERESMDEYVSVTSRISQSGEVTEDITIREAVPVEGENDHLNAMPTNQERIFKVHANAKRAHVKQEITPKNKKSSECCCSGCTCEFCCSVRMRCCFCKWPKCNCCERSKCDNCCKWPNCNCCQLPSCDNCFKCPSCDNCFKCPSCDNCCSCKWPRCDNNFCKWPNCDNNCCKWLSCSSCGDCKCCKWPSCNCRGCCDWTNCNCRDCCQWPNCNCRGCCEWPNCNCRGCCDWPSCNCFSNCSCTNCCKIPTCNWPMGCCKWPSCSGFSCAQRCKWRNIFCCLPKTQRLPNRRPARGSRQPCHWLSSIVCCSTC